MKVEEGMLSTEELIRVTEAARLVGISLTVEHKPQPVEYKVVKIVTTCTLCKTITIQYMKLAYYVNRSWVKDSDLVEYKEEVDGVPKETYHYKVKSCWKCKIVLLQKEKEELVEMVLNAYAPILTKVDVWRMVRDLRSLSQMHTEKKKSKKEREDTFSE